MSASRMPPVWALVLVACSDTVAPDAGMVLRIIAPAATDSIHDLDLLTFVGEATASDLGVLPDDSIRWTDNGEVVGRGSVVTTRARGGARAIALHARYGAREDSVAHTLQVIPGGLGRVLWTVPLDTNTGDALAFDADRAVLYARAGGSSGPTAAVAVGLDGSIRWRSELGIANQRAPPAVGPGGVLLYGFWAGPLAGPSNALRGGVLAVNPDGTQRWVFRIAEDVAPPGSNSYHVHGGVAVDPAGNVYVATEEDDGPIYSISPTGALRWRTAVGDRNDPNFRRWRFLSYTTLVADMLAAAIPRSDSLVALAAGDGALRWRGYGWAGSCLMGPAVGHDGSVYVPSRTYMEGEAYVTVYEPDGRERWTMDLPAEAHTGGPVIGRDTLYFGGFNGGVLLVSRMGLILDAWGTAPDTLHDGITLAANGVVYVAGRDTLFSWDAAGNRRFAVPVPHRPGDCSDAQGGPVVGDDGTVYLRASMLGVVALRDTVGPATDAAWPTLQGNFRRSGRRAINP